MPQTTTDTGLPKSDGIKSRLVRSFNGRLLYSVCLIAVSQINFGFDQGVFTNTQAMSQFQRKFGSYDDDTGTWSIPPYFLSLLNSLTYVGFVFGLLSGSAISKRYGRRICMFTMCIWALIGALIMVTAQHKAQILVGRVVAYIYIGMELAVVPVTQAELVPAQVRGLVIGSYQSGILLGQLLGALVCLGTEHADGDRAWRIPIGLLFIIPVLVAVGIFWVPESPRWLMVRHRDDDARKALHLLRKGKFSDEEIKNELRDLQATIDQTVDKGQFRELFQGTNLKRTLIVVGVNVFLQLTGQNFISVYGTIFLKELKTVNPFGLTAGSTSISICIVLLTQYLTDITGRKPLMVAGAIVQCACLFTMGGLGTVSNPSLGIRQGITAMYVVFGAGFSLGWAPLSHAVAAEIPTTKLRDKVSRHSDITF